MQISLVSKELYCIFTENSGDIFFLKEEADGHGYYSTDPVSFVRTKAILDSKSNNLDIILT